MSLTRRISLLACCLPAVALAAGPQLNFPEFQQLREVATDSVNISLGPWLLGLAARLIASDGDPEAAQFKELLHDVKGIYIRGYQFAADDAYPSAAVEAVRAQLSSPDWTPLAQVRSQRDGKNVDIYVRMSDDRISGLALVASGRRELTIINVVGTIDLQKLGVIERRFGLRHFAG